MVDEKFAGGQIKRLTGLSFFPTQVEAVRELIMALRIAEDERTAKEAIDHFLATSIECPKPCQIRVYAQPAEKQEEWKGWTDADIGPLCIYCNSWGYRHIGECFVRCECQSGQELPQALLDSMNSPPIHRDKDFRPFGGDDFDATVRRAIVRRMGK